MLRLCRRFRVLSCALSVLATWLSVAFGTAGAQTCAQDVAVAWHPPTFDAPAPAFDDSQAAVTGWNYDNTPPQFSNHESTGAYDQAIEELPTGALLADGYPADGWSWQRLPSGLIYRSYLAGMHEPRIGLVTFYEAGDRAIWDATCGGRLGLLRFGDCDPLRPQGFEMDFYGAAIARLDVEEQQDLDSTDYIFGVPLTYGVGDWQFKFAYAHLSSHLGDELAIREPETLDERVNYVRDSLVLGASYYPHPVWRQYAEVGWAFHTGGGASPWEAQFGTELSLPGPTGPAGTPFLAMNTHLREEHDFGGDFTVQAGWLTRGEVGQTMRVGAHYFNGKSSQFQFFDKFEEQIGLGIWYDF
jgi:hypothetical protein